MPESPIFRPSIQPSADAEQSRVLYWLTYVVLLCMFVQALLLPAQRAAERAHFHLGAASTPTLALEHEASGQVDRLEHSASRGHGEHHEDDHGCGGASLPEHLHGHGHGHAHSQLAVHDHEHGDADDVVYASARDDGPTTGQANGIRRVLLDPDGPWMAGAPIMSDKPARLIFVESTSRFRSHIVLPLERPPRVCG